MGLVPQRAQALELDTVAERRTGSVALDEIDVLGHPPGLAIGLAHGPQLAFGIRRQQAPCNVVGQADAANHAVDGVAVTTRVVQTLEHHDARTLADHESIGVGVERPAHTRRRQRPQLAEPHLRVEAVGSRHAAGEHGVGAAGPQLVTGEFHGTQTRRARRIERAASAAQPQRLGQQAGGPRRHVRIERRRQRHGALCLGAGRARCADGSEQCGFERPAQHLAGDGRRPVGRQGDRRQRHADAPAIQRAGRRVIEGLAADV